MPPANLPAYPTNHSKKLRSAQYCSEMEASSRSKNAGRQNDHTIYVGLFQRKHQTFSSEGSL